MGTVEAASREGALTLLQRHGLYVTSLEATESAPFYTKSIELSRIKSKDLVMFSRQLSIMFQSKVPLIESLTTLAEQSDKPALKEKILKISEKIEGGTSLSQALAAYPKQFDPFFVNMVRSGEASGKLSEALNYLADHLEREYDLRAKVKGAMIYPILILVMMVAVVFLMSFYVIPQLTEMLQETNVELPFITKVVIAFTNFIRGWGGFVLIGVFVAVAVLTYRFYQSKEGKGKLDRIILKVPVIGSFAKMVYVNF